ALARAEQRDLRDVVLDLDAEGFIGLAHEQKATTPWSAWGVQGAGPPRTRRGRGSCDADYMDP
ncbi:MAG: hypothetical protein KDB49_13300, partial [Mycobacterium sp.]|nr:hypothetical protein [Mycobacterium sp.]